MAKTDFVRQVLVLTRDRDVHLTQAFVFYPLLFETILPNGSCPVILILRFRH